jgi:UDP-hydrolysing UDP-N-acetyl-D-glucosamine 2-epimerase
MADKLSICVITGSRADYSYLFYPMKFIEASSRLKLQLVVTGMHLEEEFGSTAELIKKDGFKISAEVPMQMSGEDAVSITKSMGRATIGFADVFDKLKPDMALVLGDRFEIFAAVQAALIAGIPTAHIGGGDVTEGAFDDAMRHCITKMSHMHFVTNAESKERVLQVGEKPDNVHVVGSPSLDVINNIQYSSKGEFIKSVGLSTGYSKYILVTYHPETLSQNNPAADADIIIAALSDLKDTGIIITGANADTGGKLINDAFKGYADKNDNVVFHMSLGKERFYNALKHADMLIGNSSSGLYEAPTFKLPVVNIGDRQKNRLRTESVIDCHLEKNSILNAIQKAYALDCSKVISPYGDGNASRLIVECLEKIIEPKNMIRKKFYSHSK